ncbi:MAG: hypothetical protein GY795_03420 [Desulfobacterales bacterium]|nr:hypothetical protein [Desulfobacterales bacterium]
MKVKRIKLKKLIPAMMFVLPAVFAVMGINVQATTEFMTDPTVIGTNAASNAVEVQFSTPLDPESVKNSFVLKAVIPGVGYGTVAGKLEYDGFSAAKFTPNSVLLSSLNYTLTLAGAEDLNGNSLNFNGWSFTVSASETVNFPDINLEAAIRQAINKPTGDIQKSDLHGLTELKAFIKDIKNTEGLQHCTNLTELYLYSNQITNITPLAELTNLTKLYLSFNKLTDISALAGLTDLTELDISDNDVTNINAVAGLTSLTLLNVSHNDVSRIEAVTGLTNLTSLNISYNDVSDISDVAELANLTSLHLSFNDVSNISVVAELVNLTSLHLSFNDVRDMSAVAELTNLTSLDIGYNDVSDISAVAELTDLRELDISGNDISDISAVAELANLASLNIFANNVSDISAVAELANLTSLNIGRNQISDISAVALIDLKELWLYRNQISDISAVAGLTNLTWLTLYDNQISDIKPLIDNSGLNIGDNVRLYNIFTQESNPLSTTSCTDYLPQLQERGVTVIHNCQDPDSIVWRDDDEEIMVEYSGGWEGRSRFRANREILTDEQLAILADLKLTDNRFNCGEDVPEYNIEIRNANGEVRSYRSGYNDAICNGPAELISMESLLPFTATYSCLTPPWPRPIETAPTVNVNDGCEHGFSRTPVWVRVNIEQPGTYTFRGIECWHQRATFALYSGDGRTLLNEGAAEPIPGCWVVEHYIDAAGSYLLLLNAVETGNYFVRFTTDTTTEKKTLLITK